MSKFISVFGAILLSACAGGPKFDSVKAAAKDKALIYVYRPNRFGGAARSPDIYANSVKIGTIRNAGYFSAEVEPGPNLIQLGGALGDKTKGLNAPLSAGETYFLRIDFSLPAFDKHMRPDGTPTAENCGIYTGIPIFKALTSNDELTKILAGTDTRVQKDICSPGIMFVTEKFAESELKDTKLSSP